MKQFLVVLFLTVSFFACAQTSPKADEVKRVLSILAADDMEGRRAGTPGIDKAAAFIADEFKKAGLKPMSGESYMQSFVMLRPKLKEQKLEIDDVEMDAKNMIVITSKKELKINEKSGYTTHTLQKNEYNDQRKFFTAARNIVGEQKNAVVFVDTALGSFFQRLTGLKRQYFAMDHDVVFVLGNPYTKEFTLKADHDFEENKLSNVVGILPGKMKNNEMVVFSAHYDHLGIGKPVNGDSIYNGANDNAAGTTAVIMLANHFKKLGGNDRDLVFVAFTAEEMGGYGSQYFSKNINPDNVVAMFNIEMIGTESKWGKNSAYITGFDKSDMGTILQKNLKGTGFTFHPDPYPTMNLFYRSDNATLARLGVPAHTISTAKMEDEPHYHKVTDHVETLDTVNMARIIEAISKSAATIISGKDKPSRVKPESL